MYRKKIRIKMAGVEHDTTADGVIGDNVDGAEKSKKQNGFYKGLKKGVMKYISPRKTPKPEERPSEPDVVESKREITAEDIEEQIEKNRFWDASKNLIAMENGILSPEEDILLQDKKEVLKSLYEKLSTAVFTVIKDSITETQGDLLYQAVQAIVEEEKEDSKYISDSGSVKGNSQRPKQWKTKWENEIKQSVVERIDNLPEASLNEVSSTFAQTFITLGKTFKKDLTHVVTHLKPCYPEEFDICNTYAQHYHRLISSQMEDIISEFELDDKDIFFLLCWVKNIYPNNILKDPTLVGHIDESKLKRLLAPHKIRQFEANYLSYEVDSVKTFMSKSLDLEFERWKSGNEPEMLGDYYHSELHIDVIQYYNGGIQRTAEIQLKIVPYLARELEDFLKRYKRLFSEYLEKNKTQTFYRAISIANINCCLHFREFIHKDSQLQSRVQRDMQSIVVELEDLIYDALFQDLFVELKSHFRKMSQGNGLCSHQTMTDIVRITDKFVSPLKTLCTPCYQDMISKIHKHLVKEYLARLLKKKVSHKNAAQLQTLANQINENAKLIDEFFAFHNSREDWLKPAVLKVAEIIRLQDLSAIQLEVATLVQAYPDIRNKQIEAILYIKGNLTRQETKSILKIVDSIERRLSDKTRLFELIKNS
ncbi:tumor necrosis factor alpha-induced protein 2 [Pseudophryne corroboree]|uniref:tumor necrosis factor alpha-induced protein 2 n=1 Tax=Pseudophryne corroboree TaxID=495146 RepID=UPI003081BF02